MSRNDFTSLVYDELAYDENNLRANRIIDAFDEALERSNTLLKAAYNLLKKQTESPFVLNILCETTVYDDCECDGYCLMDDIKDELGLEDE